jgi:uncharacterized protein YdiU (UPF0061 family)
VVIFFSFCKRELACYPLIYNPISTFPDEKALDYVKKAFYKSEVFGISVNSEILFNNNFRQSSDLLVWIQKWLTLLQDQHRNLDGTEVSQSMRTISPKYIPREWILVRAYTDAEKGDYTTLWKCQQIFERPYEEQMDYEDEFYRRAHSDVYACGGKGGLSFMT